MGQEKKQTAMKAKRIYQEPEMKVVNINPTVMICQSLGGGAGAGGKMPGESPEEVKVLESALDGIW